MERETLASEMLHELKASNRRWFIAFMIVLALWFSTIGIFFWYFSLPVDEVAVSQGVEGDSNHIIGIGDNYVSDSDDYKEKTSSAE